MDVHWDNYLEQARLSFVIISLASSRRKVKKKGEGVNCVLDLFKNRYRVRDGIKYQEGGGNSTFDLSAIFFHLPVTYLLINVFTNLTNFPGEFYLLGFEWREGRPLNRLLIEGVRQVNRGFQLKYYLTSCKQWV